MPKKGKFVKFKNYERKTKSPFLIYADFENILVLENNENQNSEESFTNKYQKQVPCSYAHKLVCVNDKFIKSVKSYLGEGTVYNLINSMIEERKYCNEVMKIHFNKKLVMTKEDNEDFKNSTKCWICDNHCVKSVHIRSCFWPIFYCMWTEYGDLLVNLRIQLKYRKIQTRNNSVFGYFSCTQ